MSRAGLGDLHLAAKFVALVVVGLRLKWLVIEDQILDRPRTWVQLRCARKNWARTWYFLQCPWCVGFWIDVAIVVVAVRAGWASLPLPVVWPLVLNVGAIPAYVWLDRNAK